MPCYEAPPEWEGDARRNAEQAVRILCAKFKEMISQNRIPNKEMVTWYLAHRRIDLRMTKDNRSGMLDSPEFIQREIELLETVLYRIENGIVEVVL